MSSNYFTGENILLWGNINGSLPLKLEELLQLRRFMPKSIDVLVQVVLLLNICLNFPLSPLQSISQVTTARTDILELRLLSTLLNSEVYGLVWPPVYSLGSLHILSPFKNSLSAFTLLLKTFLEFMSIDFIRRFFYSRLSPTAESNLFKCLATSSQKKDGGAPD